MFMPHGHGMATSPPALTPMAQVERRSEGRVLLLSKLCLHICSPQWFLQFRICQTLVLWCPLTGKLEVCLLGGKGIGNASGQASPLFAPCGPDQCGHLHFSRSKKRDVEHPTPSTGSAGAWIMGAWLFCGPELPLPI